MQSSRMRYDFVLEGKSSLMFISERKLCFVKTIVVLPEVKCPPLLGLSRSLGLTQASNVLKYTNIGGIKIRKSWTRVRDGL